MPRSAYKRKRAKSGKMMYFRNGKLISKKAYMLGTKSKTKRKKSRAVKSTSRRKSMAKNGMFSNSKANRTAGALLGAAMPRFLGANTPYVALAAALLPKMPTALKVAGTVWASKELTDTFIGGNNNG